MNIVISGGGTGGHLYPGLEIAKFYSSLGHNVYYVASKNGVDKSIIESENGLENIQISYWDLRGIQRKLTIPNIIENIKTVGKLIYLKGYSKKFFKTNKIDFALGVGGYISYPIIVQASKLGIYTMIHEQNSYPGLVNRKLSLVVNKIGITYNSSLKYFKENNQNIINVSNPRADKVSDYANNKYYEQLGINSNKKIILFLGGSLGAETINTLFTTFVKQNLSEYQGILISGLKNHKNLENINLRDNIILENTNELLKYLATADIVVSRAGATTLLEIIYMKKKSIIIPSPNVVADHQTLNALEFYNENLIYLIKEENLTEKLFLKQLNDLQKDDKILENLQKYSKIKSLDKFKDILEEIDDIR